MKPVELGWQVGGQSGWQLFAAHLALGLARNGAQVHIADNIEPRGLSPTLLPSIQQMIVRGDRNEWRIRIDGSGNHFPEAPDVKNRVKVCLAVFEDSHLPDDRKHCWGTFDRVIACSTWAQQRLDGWGVKADVWFQGSDDSIFFPAPKRRSDDRFYVFSGGKLEFRKGQDIVVAAFKRFLDTPEGKDAVLVTAWQNLWPQTMDGIWESGYVKGVPVSRLGQLDIVSWCVANGIPAANVLDLGMIRQPDLAATLRECDVGFFPNRCEGATNMILPETMLSGIPCIVSQNTGHLDAAPVHHCVPLMTQREVTLRTGLFTGYEGWGESEVDECVEALKRVRNMHEQERKGLTVPAANFSRKHFGWQAQAKKFYDMLNG